MSKDRTSEGCSNLISIGDIAKKYKTKSQLQEYIAELHSLVGAQDLQIEKIRKESLEKDEKIEHLEIMLNKAMPIIGDTAQPSNEEVVAEMQIKRLLEKAHIRELSIEEAKMLEIYTKIKNINLKKGDNISNLKTLPKNTSSQDLLLIASGKKGTHDE
jgi:hypothetical protein